MCKGGVGGRIGGWGVASGHRWMALGARLHYGKEVAAVTVRRGIVYRFGSGLRCLETWPLCK